MVWKSGANGDTEPSPIIRPDARIKIIQPGGNGDEADEVDDECLQQLNPGSNSR